MAENPNHPDAAPRFETDDVEATRGREQGLGVGARELQAQRDTGDVQSRDDGDVHVERADEDPEGLDQSAGDEAEGPIEQP